MNICKYCNKHLSSKCYLQIHETTCKEDNIVFKCQHCDKVLSSKCYLQKHEKNCESIKCLKCNFCDIILGTNQTLQKHEKTCIKKEPKEEKIKKETKKNLKKETKKELEEKVKLLEYNNEKQKVKELLDSKIRYEKELLDSKIRSEKELLDSKIKYEKEIAELKKINNEHIQFNKETLKTVVKTNTELSKKPNINITGAVVNNNTVNTSFLSVDVSKKIGSDLFKYYKEVIDSDDNDHIITSNADMINAIYMNDDLNKILKLTDTSRNILKYSIIDDKTQEVKTVKDPKGKLVANYLIDANLEEFQNILQATTVKEKFVVKLMKKSPEPMASNFIPLIDKYGKSILYFNLITNKDPVLICDLGLQIAKKSYYKDHKEMNDQKAVENKDILLTVQNVIMKLKIYTENNFQEILVGNIFATNIWLRTALKELKVIKEWYVGDQRSDDFILLKNDIDTDVRLNNFDTMRMLQIVMRPKLPNSENIGIDGHIEKYMKWLYKSFNNLYKNMSEELKESIFEQSIDQMKKNIVMYNLDFDIHKEDISRINIIRG
jgi:hypothetical protein